MRFQDCRTTFWSPQALLALVVALAACGQERPVEPNAPFSGEARDTAAVLRAVASTIAEMNAAAERARAAPDFPANCRQPGFACWSIATTDWYVSTGDRSTAMLGDLLGVRTTARSPAVAPPACPWPSASAGTGFRAAVEVRFTGSDLAEVVLSRRCDNPPGYLHGIFSSWETFEVRRAGGTWEAKLTSVGVT
jgi:hypothetical protein